MLDSGATPAHLAASGAHLQSLSCLIKHGADIDAQDVGGDVPLDFAKRTGNPNSFHRSGTVQYFNIAENMKTKKGRSLLAIKEHTVPFFIHPRNLRDKIVRITLNSPKVNSHVWSLILLMITKSFKLQ